MIFDVPTLVSYPSRVVTLTTGDLIFTGSPDGIGTLTNRCVRITDHHVC